MLNYLTTPTPHQVRSEAYFEHFFMPLHERPRCGWRQRHTTPDRGPPWGTSGGGTASKDRREAARAAPNNSQNSTETQYGRFVKCEHSAP